MTPLSHSGPSDYISLIRESRQELTKSCVPVSVSNGLELLSDRKKWNINSSLGAQSANSKASHYFTELKSLFSSNFHQFGKMRLSHIVFVSLMGLAAASPTPGTLESSAADVADDFKPDWDAFNADFKLALEEFETDPSLAKRLNTQSANNVGYGKVIYAAGSAAYNQVKSISHWNKVINHALFIPLPRCGCVVGLMFLPFPRQETDSLI